MVAGTRSGSRFLAALLALTPLVAACSSSARTASPPSTVALTDLFGAQVTASGDELWVFGGLVAAVGTAPPVTSAVPAGWEPNRTVVAYAPDGRVTRQHRLPPIEHNITFGRVLGDAEPYLLGTMCAGAGGCGDSVDPVLYRLDGSDAEAVPLLLPPTELGEGAGVGMLLPLGHANGVAWALQLLGDRGSGYAGMADRYRLLGIELASGVAIDGELPAGIYGYELVCAAAGRVFAAQADVDDSGLLHHVRILSRTASTLTGEWRPLVELPIEPRQVWTGALHCVEDLDELVLALGTLPTEVHTFDLTSGEATGAANTIDAAFGSVLGSVDGTAVALAQDADRHWLWSHRRGEPWARQPDLDVTEPVDLVILGGALHDAGPARHSLIPGRQPLRKVDLPPAPG